MSNDTTHLRSHVVEILSNTANACFAELGLYPGMLQRMKELEETNARWQTENIKLFQDNRSLARALHVQSERLKQLTATAPQGSHVNTIHMLDARVRALEAEKTEWMKREQVAQPCPPEHQVLLAEYRKLLAAYNALLAENDQLRAYFSTAHRSGGHLSVPSQAVETRPQRQTLPTNPEPIPSTSTQSSDCSVSSSQQSFVAAQSHNVQLPPTPSSSSFVSSSPAASAAFHPETSSLPTPPPTAGVKRESSLAAPSESLSQFRSREAMPVPPPAEALQSRKSQVLCTTSASISPISFTSQTNETACLKRGPEGEVDLSTNVKDAIPKRPRIDEDLTVEAMTAASSMESQGDSLKSDTEEDEQFTEDDCLEALIGDGETHGEKTCNLCEARFANGYLEEKPKAFVNATKQELIDHCLDEHHDAWEALRHGAL